MDSKDMKFLGAGCSRLAYSLGDGWCLKKPIPERFEAGVWQNKLEYENFKLGEEEGLVCFPKAKSHNKDFSKILVEECKMFKTEQEFLDALGLPAELTDYLVKASTACKIPAAHFIGFHIFGWLEETTTKTMHDVCSFLDGVKRGGNTVQKSHACFVANILARSQVLLDVLNFKMSHPERLYIKDIWNLGQWGLTRDGKLVVIDAGYCHELARSGHFARDRVEKNVIKTSKLDMFNGERCTDILSPHGAPVEWKFYTSHGTEYVLSSLGEGRRIKQAGLRDDGLYMWTDKMVFVDEQDAINAMNTMWSIQQTLTPVKIRTSWVPGSSIDIQKLVDDCWKTQLSVVIQDTKPVVGKNVLEFMLDGDQGIVKSFHAGHDVTKLKHFSI